MIRFENVGMRYGNGPEVLTDVSFHLKPGSFHFLTGPSGAGKSSLMKLLYLAHKPSRGSIQIFDKDVVASPRDALPLLRRRIGVVFQDFRLLDHLSAHDNVALPLRIEGVREGDIQEHVSELLKWVGLAERADARPPTLSGGEKQRLAIARAVIKRPRLLLADEPTGNVDEDMARRLMRLFVELNRIGTTLVVATHDRQIVRDIGAPELMLNNGQLTLQQGTREMAADVPPALSQQARLSGQEDT